MPKLDEKLLHFTQAFMDEARAETSRLEAEIKAAREAAVTQAEDQVLQEAYQYMKTEVARIRTEAGRNISRRVQENKRRLSLRREEMAREVFSLVRDRLAAYVETPAYQDRLLSLFQEGVARLGRPARLTVLLRPQDMGAAARLRQAAEGIELTAAEGDFLLGGLVLEAPDKALRLDATFDTAMEDLNGHFAEQFGLSLSQ